MTTQPPAVNGGHLGFSQGTSLVDKVIQYGTASRYNHVVVSIEDEKRDGTILVVEARTDGAKLRYVKADRFVWDDVKLTNTERKAIAQAARECEGLPYDWSDIVRFIFFHRLGKVRGWTKDRADDKVICSEIGAWALARAGVYPFGAIAPGDISPGDLADWAFRNDERRPKVWR